MHQLICLTRHRTEAVYHSLSVSSQVIIILDTIQLTIKQHSLTTSRHIGIREIHFQVTFHCTVIDKVIASKLLPLLHLILIKVIELLVLQFRDGLRKNLLISLITQVFHKATLFRTEQVASTSNIQVLHGKVESTSQLTECLQGFQSSTSISGKHTLRWSYQIAERLLVASSYPTSHLVQVAQSEVMGIIDNDGIGVGYINAIRHNSRREQHIIIIIDKTHDDIL